MSRQLVILAAGIGRRFGGLKQLEPVGPNGEVIMDYTVADARRAGFDAVVLVVRPEIEDEMRRHVEAGFGRDLEVTFVHQELAALPDGCTAPRGRTRPWGTGQALLSATLAVTGPFGVVNADDYYGRPAMLALGDFLARSVTERPTWALVGFEVGRTLPAEGAVSRGLIKTADGFLEGIEECLAVRREGDLIIRGDGRTVSSETLVSMNLWGFGPEVLSGLEEDFRRFLSSDPGLDHEFFLPESVARIARETGTQVRVIPTASDWCGVTSAADLPAVRRVLDRSP